MTSCPAGLDPDVGRKLYSWFTAAGLTGIRVEVRPYQVHADGIPAGHWPNWHAKLRTITELLAGRTGDRAYWQWFRDAMAGQLHRPGLFYQSTLVIATGRKPDSRRSGLFHATATRYPPAAVKDETLYP